MPEIRRPDDSRFQDLPGWPYVPRYIDGLKGYEGLRMHYIDEQKTIAGQHRVGTSNLGQEEQGKEKEVFLCLHGQPTWSYLYRHMIPVFLDAGKRVIAADFFGFGRSDKPVDDAVYTFDFHRQSLLAFIQALSLKRITLVVQDWGGLIGLTLPMDLASRVDRLLVMNTVLATGDFEFSASFYQWREWAAAHPDVVVSEIIGPLCPQLGEKELAAYDAPFSDIRDKAGVRRFPQLVPDNPQAPGAQYSRRARDWLSASWRGQSFAAHGSQDTIITDGAMSELVSMIRGCPPAIAFQEAGHFVQEWGAPVARAALTAFQAESDAVD